MWGCFPSLLRSPGCGPVGQPAIHPSTSDHDGVRPRPGGLNQVLGHTTRCATALVERASVRGRSSGGDWCTEAQDFSAAERIEHEGQQLSSHCDASLVLAVDLIGAWSGAADFDSEVEPAGAASGGQEGERASKLRSC
jgi:hypothetical protein